MRILGVSAFYHDSAAALVVDGKIATAAREQRSTREKHDSGFPRQAIDYCLAHTSLRVRVKVPGQGLAADQHPTQTEPGFGYQRRYLHLRST